ncbi:energy-coupling factor ABC transporter substrate-binding protein [Marinitenerispora sediminis]|uniref:Cobalt transport protein CbiN n=1 Tax=Marinitenerispora sediminis TaxID=1931232 RepID=A0A368T8H1_9ACTN|nr:energy-coupling factor ABC transporter substrate-binding protein [Marinitenerispora sediminis]RCV52041.1 energy-coupling factor ABC transporter substrate-binding protein [Marinitenerispora sediminis]RCV54690.1 energy-coupling factor ABC transporter substrate-binding protein [Marinitenerispora sediminis]RCV60378.1 energy-coupling factor ABC transporter substrate-binding protein [Marinitenerispora sediminis]
MASPERDTAGHGGTPADGGGPGPRTSGRPRAATTWLLVLVAALIAVLPLLIGAGRHLAEPFAGADGQAEEAVGELAPDYRPWFAPLYEAPSGEIESGLFALQAAIGAGVIGYYFGAARTRHRLRPAAGGVRPGGGASPGAEAGPGTDRR